MTLNARWCEKDRTDKPDCGVRIFGTTTPNSLGIVDIVPIAQEVITEVDIGSIVRASTGSIGGDARDSVRITSMRVDGFVGKVADKVLLRRKARNTVVPDYDPAQFVSEPVDHSNDPIEEPAEAPDGGGEA